MSSVSLSPGGNISLTKDNPLMDSFLVGFGWNIITSNSALPELVPSAIMCDKSGQAISDEHMVFFNQLSSPDNSVAYNDTDEEQIQVTLSAIPQEVDKIVFIVYIDPDIKKPTTFSSLRSHYIRVSDSQGNDIARCDITDTTGKNVTAMIFGEIYRRNNEWKFRALAEGFANGLMGVSQSFKVALS